MFSKPLVAAGLIASTNAAATLSGVLTQTTGGTYYGQYSCFKCFSYDDARWTYRSDSVAWQWSQTAEATSGTKALVIGAAGGAAAIYKEGFCCKDKTTTDTSAASSTKACDQAYSATTTLATNFASFQNPTSGDWNLMSQVAICPAYASICGAPVQTVSGNKATIGTDKRTAVLTTKGDAVTLQMAVPINNASQNWGEESCSYVVASNCGAPIVSIDSTSNAAANDYALYFMEYTGIGATGLTLVGPSTGKFFLPVATKAYTETWATAAVKMPNDELAAVNVYTGTANTSYARQIPGQALLSWMASVQAGYTNYDSTVVLYEAARKEWDDGKRGAKPYQPKQPDAAPTLLDQLKYSVSTQTLKATQVSGFGAVTQYQIEWGSVNVNAGHYFGTLAGVSTRDSATASSISTTAKSSHHWASNSGKTATGTGTTLCDKAYIQVTGHLKKINASAAAKMYVVVTEGEWAKTLEESIPSRPVATTAPKDSGAAYLSLGATAALVALSLS